MNFINTINTELLFLKRILVIAVIVAVALEWAFPQHSVAAADYEHTIVNVVLNESVVLPIIEPQIFPETELRTARYQIKVTISAYSSTIDQTDDTPFITASGEVVHDGIVAANWLPLGAHIRIPEQFGDKVFVVEDRMNARYTSRLDIWMSTREQATDWGLKYITVEVL